MVYEKSRKAAENKAAQEFLNTADPRLPIPTLAKTKAVTVDMEFDEESGVLSLTLRKLHGISTYGTTELDALNSTAEMIRGYLASMKANHKKRFLSRPKAHCAETSPWLLINVDGSGTKR